jgi:hypothetical protein
MIGVLGPYPASTQNYKIYLTGPFLNGKIIIIYS